MSDPRNKFLSKLGQFKDKVEKALPGHTIAPHSDKTAAKKEKKHKKDKHKQAKAEKEEKNKHNLSKDKNEKKSRHKAVSFGETPIVIDDHNHEANAHPSATDQLPPPPPFRSNPVYEETVTLLERVINQGESLDEVAGTIIFAEGEQNAFQIRLAALKNKLHDEASQAEIPLEIQQLRVDLRAAGERAKAATKEIAAKRLQDEFDKTDNASKLKEEAEDLNENVKIFEKKTKPKKNRCFLFSCCFSNKEKSEDEESLLKSPSIQRP